jgi:hypothetical protein
MPVNANTSDAPAKTATQIHADSGTGIGKIMIL